MKIMESKLLTLQRRVNQMIIAEFNIPVYFVQKFKTKKDKIHFVGMNWYR